MKKIDLVNLKHGTKNTYRYSNGNVLPIVGRPHGMATFCLQTQSGTNMAKCDEKLRNGAKWFYDPTVNYYEGIRLTHQFSPFTWDFGHILFVPQSGKEMLKPWCLWSSMKNSDTVMKPNYLKVRSLRYQCTTELTTSMRGGVMRVTYEKEDAKRLTILPFRYESDIKIEPENRRLIGYSKAAELKTTHEDFALYFVLEFSSAIDLDNTKYLKKKGIGTPISVAFQDKVVEIRLAISFISIEQAEENLRREISGKTFEDVQAESEAEWEEVLSRIEVNDDNSEKMKTFYSCLWRTFLYPTTMHEIDKTGKLIHVCPETNLVSDGYFFTGNCFWDTTRTLYPLYSLIAPKEFSEICEGILNYVKDTGWLPQCLSPGEGGLMPGCLVEGALAEAVIHDIVDKDTAREILYILIDNIRASEKNKKRGRKGCVEYDALGYVPCDKYKESVNATLDSAYGDYCIAQVAQKLGENELAKKYYQRSKNYANLFDPKTGFIRGKTSKGRFRARFCPEDWGGDYCEGGAWQNAFGVYHDIEGLAKLYGGKTPFLKKIDELFATPPVFNTATIPQEIHEMGEMATNHFGQCAISNQPSFHIPWIYSALGEQEKTEYWIERIADEAFSSDIDGYPGDEDTGSMAAWYIFACLGFYPFCPGSGRYVESRPLLCEIKFNTPKFRNVKKLNDGLYYWDTL